MPSPRAFTALAIALLTGAAISSPSRAPRRRRKARDIAPQTDDGAAETG